MNDSKLKYNVGDLVRFIEPGVNNYGPSKGIVIELSFDRITICWLGPDLKTVSTYYLPLSDLYNISQQEKKNNEI